MEEVIEKLISGLAKILTNIKKSPNRKYRRATLIEKLEKSDKLYNDIISILELVEDKKQIFILKSARQLYGEIKCLIKSKLEHTHLISFKNIVITITSVLKLFKKIQTKNMTSNIEMIKLVTSLVQPYDGRNEKLGCVLDALKTIKPLVTNENRSVTIQAIVSRFSDKARQAIPNILPATTVDDIINGLEIKCKTKASPDTVVAKLNATKQNGDINQFTDAIEKLSLDLEKAYIDDDIPAETSAKMARKAAIKALYGGVRNQEVKVVLKAGQFNTLTNAIQKNELSTEHVVCSSFKI